MNNLSLDEAFESFIEEDKVDQKDIQSFLEDIDFKEIIVDLSEDLQDQNQYEVLEEKLNEFINEKEEELRELEENLNKPRKEIVQEVIKEQPIEVQPDMTKFEEQFNKLMQNWNKRFNALIANMNMRAPTGSSGGSTRILDNDDVVFKQLDQVANNQVLSFNSEEGKFQVRDISTSFFTRIPVTSNTATINTSSFDTIEALVGVQNTQANTNITVESGFDVGKRLYIKDEQGNASLRRIKVTTIDTIDGQNSFTLAVDYGSVTMIYTGYEWSIV